MQNSQENLSNIPTSNAKFSVKFLVFVIIIVVALTIAYFVLKETQQDQNYSPAPETSEKTEKVVAQPNYDILATDFFKGIIKEISGNKLKIETGEEERNPYLRNRNFEVLVEDKTEIFLLQGYFFIKQNKESTEIEVAKDNFGDDTILQTLIMNALSVGDMVIVLSFESLKEKDSFIAREIYRTDF